MHAWPNASWRRLRYAAQIVACAAFGLAAAATTAQSGTLSEVPNFGSNPGRLKMFKYGPARLQEPAPLVVVLHGCNQSASYFERSGWAKYADENGFMLLVPEQQFGPGPVFSPGGRNHPTRCFNFAELRDSRRDSGEALSIKQMIDTIKDQVSIDPSRVFVTGLSAGGGMTAVMLATYPEVFSGGAIIAGLPYRCGTRTATAPADCGVTLQGQAHNPAPNRTPAEWGQRVRQAVPQHQGPWPRVSIWQGTADQTVDPPNAQEVVEQWTNVHGIDQGPDETESGANYTRHVFKDAQGKALVERFEIRGFGHATPIDPDSRDEPCGSLGDPFIVDGNICSTHRIARFWGLIGEPPTVTIASATAQGTTVRVNGTANDPDGTVAAVTVRLEGSVSRPATQASGIDRWSVAFNNLQDNTRYTPVVTATDNEGFVTTISGSPVVVGNVPANVPPTVLINLARAEQDCIVVSGVATDTDGRVTEVAVKLGARNFSPVSFTQGQYRFRECRLPGGTYTVQVRATDDLGATGEAERSGLQVDGIVPVSANWQEHMAKGRLRIYQAPCPSIGFGACDEPFPTLFLKHQFSTFNLFHRPGSNDWYVDPAHIP
jgi:poly(hydroxyalkanoate) depolymerase family esterase